MIKLANSIGGPFHFKIMVEQLGMDRATALLGVHRTTITRLLNKGDNAKVPRAYVAALYWETKWGRSEIDSDHLFEVQLLHHKINFLKKENARLVQALSAQERMMDNFGAANAPVLNLQTMR